MSRIDFQTEPSRYRHWRLEFEGPVASLIMDVDPQGGLFEGYELKLNSYDLGVDIELYDAVQRLRFEHPEVGAVVIRSGKEGVFCAGANIRMLGKASHGHKVNFCKFTNETRLAIEDATEHSRQTYIAAVTGPAAGGGYELAVCADHIMLVDDRRSSVALPEMPLLAVLPGTGGLTRVTDKRRVRRDLADVFCATEEGVRGKRAVEWRLVDEVVPPSKWDAAVRERALGPGGADGSARRCAGHPARSARSPHRARHAGLPASSRHARSRPRPGRSRRPGAHDAGAGEPGGGGGARRRVLAAGGCPRARRRHPAPAHQRAGARAVAASDGGRPRCRPRP